MNQPDDNDNTRTHVVLTNGMMVSHYRIVQKIGAGGMGEVYLAEDTKLNRKVALKFLPPHLCQDEDCRTRFKREAQAAAKLDHPNIVTIHEVSEYQGRPFFAMQHVEGQSLRDHAKARELDIEQVVNLAIQLCDGLGAAHDKKVIHRDIKPSNIVIDAYGRPKILDFGLAAIQGGEHLTKTGSTLGTVRYMSPEQVKGKEIDHRSDLFSLGVVLYELIASQSPFSRDNDMATGQAIVNDSPEPLTRYRANVPEPLQAIVAKLLEKDPNLRYQSAAGVIPDLRQLRRRSDSDATATMPVRGQRRNLMPVLVPTALAIVVALVLILKPWKFEISPEQEAVAAENSLAIMYFDNLADPDDNQRLGEIAANLLITDLTESVYLDVVSSQRLYDILKLLGREGETKIDRGVATEVAKKAGSKWMLLGSVLQVEPQLIITAQLVDVESGRAVASQRITGEAGDNIFTVVDQLTIEVKNDMSLPQQAQDEIDRAVADVTTHSPEAYRHYLEGVRYNSEYIFEEAEKSYQKALEYDSTFAMAYFRLATTRFLAHRGAMNRKHMARAVEYSTNLNRKEKLYIESFRHIASRDYSNAVIQLEEIARLFPQEKEAFLFLGGIHLFIRRAPEDAVSAFSDATGVDSLYAVAYNYLAYSYDAIGEIEKSDWAIDMYLTLAPDETNPYDSRGDLYADRGKVDQAIEYYQKALAIKPDQNYTLQKLGLMYIGKQDYERAESYFRQTLSDSRLWVRQSARASLAAIPIYRGRFEEALTLLDEGITADRMELGRDSSLFKHLLKAELYNKRENVKLAMQEMGKAMEIARNAGSVSGERQVYVQLLAENDSIAKAEEVAAALKKDLEEKDPTLLYLYWYARGCIESARGNHRESAACFEKATETVLWGYTTGFSRMNSMLGRSYLKTGQLGDAVAQFEIVLSKKLGFDPPFMPVITHYHLGQAYEASGWNDRAIEQYETFLDIWKNADEGLESVEDAKTRLVQLKGES